MVQRLELADYHYLHATRGELLTRLSRSAEAGDAYRRALEPRARTPSGDCSSGASPRWAPRAPR
jgi:RNA polymerase sigma-70 factor (ECF subfamily)